MGGIRLQVTGVAEVKAKAQRLRRNLTDWDELWDRITDVMIEHEEILFATEGATAEPPWPPLAEATLQKKARLGLPLDAMVATERLKESLTSPEAGEVGQGRSTLGTFTQDVFSWGTDVEYAGYHVDPRFAPEHTDPNRPPIRNLVNVTPDLLERVNEAASGWLDDAVREAGFA
jgi:hypothetical protein